MIPVAKNIRGKRLRWYRNTDTEFADIDMYGRRREEVNMLRIMTDVPVSGKGRRGREKTR